MGPHQDYLFIAIVVGCFALAVGIGYVMYRNGLRRPEDAIDRSDSFAISPVNDDAPPIMMRPRKRG